MVTQATVALAPADRATIGRERGRTRGLGRSYFFVGNEMFWGKDRLDFVERWVKRPE